MSDPRYQVSFTSTFRRQYKKLTSADKELADAAIENLVALVNIADPTSDEARRLGVSLRTKVIQKFRKKRPKRMEATFAPDGRIVWVLDGDLLRLIYIGPHSVLNKE